MGTSLFYAELFLTPFVSKHDQGLSLSFFLSSIRFSSTFISNCMHPRDVVALCGSLSQQTGQQKTARKSVTSSAGSSSVELLPLHRLSVLHTCWFVLYASIFYYNSPRILMPVGLVSAGSRAAKKIFLVFLSKWYLAESCHWRRRRWLFFACRKIGKLEPRGEKTVHGLGEIDNANFGAKSNRALANNRNFSVAEQFIGHNYFLSKQQYQSALFVLFINEQKHAK